MNSRLRLGMEWASEDRGQEPYERDPRVAQLEALFFLSDEPLTSRRLIELLGLKKVAEAIQLVNELRSYYVDDGSAFSIEEVAGGFQLLTKPAYHPWLLRLRRTGHDVRLSAPALETLAVVAYRQPVTRADVEAIRGVSCTELIRMLMEKGLVRVCGRHDSLGRPQLYGTTKKFLQVYGMNSLADLPEIAALPRPKG